MESSEEDSVIRELMEDIEEDSSSLSPEQIMAKIDRARQIGEEVFNGLPQRPDDYVDYMVYLFFYSVQFAILYLKVDGEKPITDPVRDSEQVIREKAYFIHLFDCYKEFTKEMEKFAGQLYEKVMGMLEGRLSGGAAGPSQKVSKDPLWIFLDRLPKYKELHSRRLKTDPSASRTKTDDFKASFNSVTHEQFDPLNPDHKSWRALIVNPLPSDFDDELEDPKLGGAHQIEVLKEQNKYHIPDPYQIIVNTEWDKLIRILHTCLFFNEYMHTYIVGCISVEDERAIKGLSWIQTWDYLFKEHSELNIDKLSREKKGTPLIVSRTAELRDFINEVLLFL